MTVLERLLPRRLDNTYGGRRLALWILAAVVIVKTGIALGTIFNGRTAAQSADGIPLESFGAAGAQAVVALFAAWGVGQLVLSALGILALARYRAMVPLVFALILLEHLARRISFIVQPIVRTGTPPGLWINLTLLALMTVGLALALWERAEVVTPR